MYIQKGILTPIWLSGFECFDASLPCPNDMAGQASPSPFKAADRRARHWVCWECEQIWNLMHVSEIDSHFLIISIEVP